MLQRDVIGQLIWNQNYYWLNIKMKIVEMVFVRLVDVPDCWRNRGDPNKVNEQSKRLTTQVVFTAAIYEISLTCSVLSWSYCTVRASVRSVFGVVCPRKLLKERAVEQRGVKTSVFIRLSLSNLSQSATVCLVVCVWAYSNMPKTVDEDFKDMEKETILFHGKTGKVTWFEFEKSIARYFLM